MSPRLARLSGAITQGLILGVLLFLSLWVLLGQEGGGRLFRYQGF